MNMEISITYKLLPKVVILSYGKIRAFYTYVMKALKDERESYRSEASFSRL